MTHARSTSWFALVGLAVAAANCGGVGGADFGQNTGAGGAPACAAGMTACNGTCVDTSADPHNCGGCGIACAEFGVCASGSCTCSGGGEPCGAGKTCCGASCENLTNDANNCGMCGKVCPANETCVNSACSCDGGADLMTDPANCGQCGKACAANETCVNGACFCSNPNACGGCSTLSPAVGTPCPYLGCGATYTCNGTDAVHCVDPCGPDDKCCNNLNTCEPQTYWCM